MAPIAVPAEATSGTLLAGPGRLSLPPHAGRPVVADPESAHDLLRPHLADLDRERCVLLTLDVRSRLIAIDLVSVGTAASTFIAPREVFRDALLRGACSVMVAHNHPSGDPAPSEADRVVTRRLRRAGDILGVPLVDHLVVGDEAFCSLARLGW